MASKSAIEWTDSTWNPVTGCTKISAGCRHCYAERMARRLQAMGVRNYANGFKVTVHERTADLPLTWRKPQMVFVNSMGDLFHRDVPAEFIRRVFQTMKAADRHVFQILTKRAGRLAQLSPSLPWSENIWMGVTVESQDCAGRISHLRETGALTKCLSCEPLLGPIAKLDLTEIDWVIVGGESGPEARPMKEEWAVAIRDQAIAAGIPFFFKQWGGRNKKRTGRMLDGRTWDEMPQRAPALNSLATG